MLWLWLFISGLILVIVLLLIKIHLLRKSAKEIECSFAEKLITDSNTLIDISSNDKYMCHLANEINIQLRKLRAERRKFQKGDIELKNAVTNVSHDLRTPLTAIYGYLDLLEQEEKSEKVNRYIAVIKNRTEMLKQLTEELFRYSVILTSEEPSIDFTSRSAPIRSRRSRRMRNISPAFPTAREPISFRPSILALPFVAIFSISYPLGAWLLEFRRCSRKATRNSSKRFDPSLLALPSTARPTGTSSFNISGILQIPEESFMLEIGQCATPVPVSA